MAYKIKSAIFGTKDRLLSLTHRCIAASKNPGVTFVVLASILGLITLVVMPPYMVPDEQAHLFRSYQISTGHIFSVNHNGETGGMIPSDYMSGIATIYQNMNDSDPNTGVPYKKLLTTKLASDTVFVRFDSTAVYSPVSYLPQIIGVTVGRIIYPSNLFILYTARLFALAAYIALLYFAIRVLPISKWFIVVAGLLPMSIQQMASVSSDVMTIGLAFVAVAYCLKLYYQKNALSKKQVVIVALIGALLGLTKQTNALLILPFLFLPARLYRTVGQRYKRIGIWALATFGAALTWYALTKLLNYNLEYAPDQGVDMARQLHFLLQHPLEYIKILFRTFVFNNTPVPPNPEFYWQSIIGYFSWFKYALPLSGMVLAYLLLATSLLYRPINPEQTKKAADTFTRFVYLGTFIVSVVAIATVLYLIWTPVGAPVVAGIQGRYFIPLLILLIPVFYTTKIRLIFARASYMPLFTTAVVLSNFGMMLILTVRYFQLV